MSIDSNILLLRRIWAIVEDACMAAQDDLKPTSHEAINWGDLDCAEVGRKMMATTLSSKRLPPLP